MTTETRVVFDLKDIKTIQFECKTCHSRFVCAPEKWNAMPLYCGNCKEPLLTEGTTQHQSIVYLRESLLNLLKFYQESKLVVRFEI